MGNIWSMRTVTGFENFTTMANVIFWVATQCSSVEVYGYACHLLIAVFQPGLFLQTLKEAMYSSEMLVNYRPILQTLRQYSSGK
jgi:hypothetical protein